jgi:hypothetical protein
MASVETANVGMFHHITRENMSRELHTYSYLYTGGGMIVQHT